MFNHLLKQGKYARMIYGHYGPTIIEIPISDNKTETTWVTDGVSMSWVKRRINEISGDYYVDLASVLTTSTPATADSSSSSSSASLSPLNMIQNECYSYPSTTVLFGLGFGIALIILLLMVNLIVMKSKKQLKYSTGMENVSDEPLRFHEMFPGSNRAREQQQQQRQPQQQ